MTTETLTQPTIEYGADALIVCDNLVRIYQVENIEVQALQGLDLLVDKGEMIAIVGQSGSGKSTLLNVLSGLDVPTAGAARVAGWDLLRMTHADRLNYRRSVVGFVWQQTGRNLLPYLSAKENVMLPMAFAGIPGKKRAAHANELLAAMGMVDKAGRRPGQLSGGEQQRVAIAVALANDPEVIFADEPTGELDSATGDDVFEALRAANRDLGATVVVVTHDHAVSSQVQRTVAIRDGRTATEVVRRTHVDEEGVTQTVHEEYAVLDRAGRMQLPRDYRTALGLKDRVRLELESDHIGVWADGSVKKVRHEPVVPTAAPDVEVPAETAVPIVASESADAPVAEPIDDAAFAAPLVATTLASAYEAPRPVVENPSKPPAPMTGAIPVVATFDEAAEVDEVERADQVAEVAEVAEADDATPDSDAESAPRAPSHQPSAYANLSAYEPPLSDLDEEPPYSPVTFSPVSPTQAEDVAEPTLDPYAPPSQGEQASGGASALPPRAPWLPKENDND